MLLTYPQSIANGLQANFGSYLVSASSYMVKIRNDQAGSDIFTIQWSSSDNPAPSSPLIANGSILGKTYNPWYYKSSEVDIFRESDGSSHRVLGADGHFYRRQLEGFAEAVLEGKPMRGADVADGIASVRAMVAIAQSARTGRPVTLAEAAGEV